jgi:hypothetical protein
MKHVVASLEVASGKTREMDDVGRLSPIRKFHAEDDGDAKLQALALLKQTARRWRTSDRFTFTELICRDNAGGKSRVYHCRGILCEKQTILRMALSRKNAEEAWIIRCTNG